ncbi:MAG: HPr kinase/phosphatase C-terminal domain-containing protein [Sulfitobacter sp.]
MCDETLTLHASCVAWQGKGILIIGPSGSGKSALALHLIANGAELLADDRTVLAARGGDVSATCPPNIVGLIEARNVGILTLPNIDSCRIALVVDMSQNEVARLPEKHIHTVLDIAFPCLHKVDASYFPTAIIAYLRGLPDETQ